MLRPLLFIALSLASLTSSAQDAREVAPFRPIAADKRGQLEALRTSDPAELRKRWGPFVDLAGKVWVPTKGASSGFEVHWVIEGAVAQLTEFFACRNTPCQRRIGLLTYLQEPPFGMVDVSYDIEWSDRGAARGFLSGDALHVNYGGFNGARYKFDAQTGLGYFGGYDYRNPTDQELQALAAQGLELESQKAERQRQAAESQRLAVEARAKADAERALAAQSAEESRRRAAEEAALRRKQEEERQAVLRAEAEAKAEADATSQRLKHAALRAKFPAINLDAPRVAQFKPAAGAKDKPEILVVEVDRPGRYRLDVVGEGFAPHVTVYDTAKPQPIAKVTAVKDWAAGESFTVNALGTYVVVVQSADGNAGWYALRLSQ